MTTSTSFSTFLNNIKVDKSNNINSRYKEITKKLNRTFRDTDSETANSLQVGSYGRYTGIKGISDLDMLYIMPKCKWNDYKNKPSTLLADVRDAIQNEYLQLIIPQYFISNKSGIWSLSLIVHSKG